MLAEHIKDTLSVDAKVMSMAESAAGYPAQGEGGGAVYCLRAIDTHLGATRPGSAGSADLLPEAGWWMIGFWFELSNPKAMVATLAEVFRCFESNVPLLGDLSLEFAMEAYLSPFQTGVMQACRTVSCIS